MLKFSVDSLDTVDEAHRPLYVEKDGKFTLAVEGAVAKNRLDEFRESNVSLKKQVEDLSSKFDGVDLDKYREFTSQEQKIRDKELIDAGKVEDLIAERVGAMRGDHEKVVKAIAKERDTAKSQLEGLVVDGALRDAAIKAGVVPSAVDDVLGRGKSVFKVVDGRAVAFDGDKQLYGTDSEPLSVAGWLGTMTERAPHWFPPSTGGGAPKGGSQAQGGEQKSIKRADFEALGAVEQFAAIKAKTKITD